MDKKISISQIKEVVQQAYEQVKGNTGGKNADYIPYLANIDKNLFGISVCLLNGQTITVGDFDYRFGIESVSKVHTAILILRQYGAQKVLEMIGADATGLPFNSIIAILLENDHPSTPLVNAGAISACSMVTPIGNSDKKWDAIVKSPFGVLCIFRLHVPNEQRVYYIFRVVDERSHLSNLAVDVFGNLQRVVLYFLVSLES